LEVLLIAVKPYQNCVAHNGCMAM